MDYPLPAKRFIDTIMTEINVGTTEWFLTLSSPFLSLPSISILPFKASLCRLVTGRVKHVLDLDCN